MSKSNVRLPQFLSEVDALTENMSHGELQAFVHEIARTFLILLHSEKCRNLWV